MSLFDTQDYKEFIKLRVSNLKQINSRYTFDALATAMNVHKPYLSKVLNKKGNFTDDQLYRGIDFLKLNDLERAYFELLYKENTSEIPERKIRLNTELGKIRKKALKSSSLYDESENVENTEAIDYFIDPNYALIHMHLLVAKYRENVELIADNLHLPKDILNGYIENLHNMRIIQKKGKEIKVIKEFIHLPENSKLIVAFRNLSKYNAIERLSQTSSDNYLSMHVFFTADETARNKIQKLFLDFLTESKKIADKSKSDDVFQLNFDLLKWT